MPMARKTRNPRLDLPPLELDCMRALWSLGQATVQEVRACLTPERPLAYTTVMTLMDRLARKGVVERRKQGRAHLYTPAVAEIEVRERALERFVEDFFSGSRAELRAHLGGAPEREFRPPPPAPKAPADGTRPHRSPAPPGSDIDTSLL